MTPSIRAQLHALDLTDQQAQAVERILEAELRASAQRITAVLAEAHDALRPPRRGEEPQVVMLRRRALAHMLETWQTPGGYAAAEVLHERWRHG